MSWRDWPRGLGACLWHTIQEFNSPIPPQPFGDVVLVVTHRFCTPKLGVRLPPSPPGTLARKPPGLSSIGSKSGVRFAQGDQPDEPQDDRPRTNILFAACVGLVITLA
jgi:hypothetical protein